MKKFLYLVAVTLLTFIWAPQSGLANMACTHIFSSPEVLTKSRSLKNFEALQKLISTYPEEAPLPAETFNYALYLLHKQGVYFKSDKEASLYYSKSLKPNPSGLKTVRYVELSILTQSLHTKKPIYKTIRLYKNEPNHNEILLKAVDIFGINRIELGETGVIGVMRKQRDPIDYYFKGIKNSEYEDANGVELFFNPKTALLPLTN